MVFLSWLQVMSETARQLNLTSACMISLHEGLTEYSFPWGMRPLIDSVYLVHFLVIPGELNWSIMILPFVLSKALFKALILMFSMLKSPADFASSSSPCCWIWPLGLPGSSSPAGCRCQLCDSRRVDSSSFSCIVWTHVMHWSTNKVGPHHSKATAAVLMSLESLSTDVFYSGTSTGSHSFGTTINMRAFMCLTLKSWTWEEAVFPLCPSLRQYKWFWNSDFQLAFMNQKRLGLNSLLFPSHIHRRHTVAGRFLGDKEMVTCEVGSESGACGKWTLTLSDGSEWRCPLGNMWRVPLQFRNKSTANFAVSSEW